MSLRSLLEWSEDRSPARRTSFSRAHRRGAPQPRSLYTRTLGPAADLTSKYASSFSCFLAARERGVMLSTEMWSDQKWFEPGDSDDSTEWAKMNLCALTMRNNNNVRDDRPFSGPIKTYVAPFKGLKGGRNGTSVTYRSNFFQDDLDDPELAFDNNNTFRDECIAHAMTDKMLHCKNTRNTAHGKLFQIKLSQMKTRSCWFSKFQVSGLVSSFHLRFHENVCDKF